MSPSGRHSHSLETMSSLRVEVTLPFQVVCGDHWPGSQERPLLPLEVVVVVSPWGPQWVIQGLEVTGHGPSAWQLSSENRVARTITASFL